MGKRTPRCKTCGYTLFGATPAELVALLEGTDPGKLGFDAERAAQRAIVKTAQDAQRRSDAAFYLLGAHEVAIEMVAARLLGFCDDACRKNKRSLEQLDAFKAAAKSEGFTP